MEVVLLGPAGRLGDTTLAAGYTRGGEGLQGGRGEGGGGGGREGGRGREG